MRLKCVCTAGSLGLAGRLEPISALYGQGYVGLLSCPVVFSLSEFASHLLARACLLARDVAACQWWQHLFTITCGHRRILVLRLWHMYTSPDPWHVLREHVSGVNPISYPGSVAHLLARLHNQILDLPLWPTHSRYLCICELLLSNRVPRLLETVVASPFLSFALSHI